MSTLVQTVVSNILKNYKDIGVNWSDEEVERETKFHTDQATKDFDELGEEEFKKKYWMYLK